MTILVHTIMCGGSGTRLWPWSRRSYPKQFLSLLDERSLLQATVDRLDDFDLPVETIGIGNEEHRFLIAEQLRDTRAANPTIVLEPEGRNTAPVALVAALYASDRLGEDRVVMLAPADHHIADAEAYRAALTRAIPVARAGYVVTFGIAPDRPETGYGYIEMGSVLEEHSCVRTIAAFREKPDLEAAKEFIARKSFVWNSGIFLFTPQTMIELAKVLAPEMLDLCRRSVERAEPDLDFLRLDAESYKSVESISFDYAFAEHLDAKGAVIPVTFGWSDVGSWAALRQALGGQQNGANVVQGPAELFDCSGTLAMSDGPLIVSQGLENTVIVANHDAVYVAAADQCQDIKRVVAELEKKNRREAVTHEKTYRPWGWYQTINCGQRFQVKEIVVHPGGQLSLQAHHHRAEHWVVVRGTAKVTIGDKEKSITENESIFVPLGARHRLENPGRIPMHLIEVQTGSYLEEDDIVRFDDKYGRA